MANTYVDRMQKEAKELRAKIYALSGYLTSKNSSALPNNKRVLMDKQLKRMKQYNEILEERLALEEV